MIKQIAWNTFKNTGDIHTMMELIEMDKAIKNNQEKNRLSNLDEPIDNIINNKLQL